MSFVNGSAVLNDVPLAETSLLGVTVGASGLDASIDWGQLTRVTTQFDTDAVRQGRAIDPVNTVTRPFTGAMTANWSVADLEVTAPGFGFPFDIGTTGLSTTGTCSVLYSGAPYVCHFESDPQTPVDTSPFPGPYVGVKLVADITVTPQALATLRTASVGGAPVGTANLALSETSTTDPLSAACTAGVGDHLTYALGTLASTPGLHVQANLQVEVGASIDNPDPTDPNPIVRVPLASPSFPFAAVDTSIALSGAGTTFDLGGVQADDQPVTAVAGGPYAGTEGAPIAFDGSGSTVGCGAALHWTFSDGGSADGAQVNHTFADNGTYTGTLTATKGSESDATTFSVTVDNGLPSVDAGGDSSAGVNAAVSFVGTATDPSSVDQGSLTYTWEFGDGSPNGTASGQTASHSFALPGVYDVTLTVCDKDGGCTVDTRRVTVAQATKATITVYFGDLIGRSGYTTDLRAIVVDRNLQPLAGRTVTFTLGNQTTTATTDAHGVATAKLKITQRLGLYAVTASWRPGDTQYAGSSMTLPYLVLR
jgi:PKD repeat protein